jgi:hypothetical protein
LLSEVENSQVRLFTQAEKRTYVVYLQGEKIKESRKERKKERRDAYFPWQYAIRTQHNFATSDFCHAY